MISPFDYPQKEKQVVLASDDEDLKKALDAMATDEDAEVRLIRPDTPDIVVFSGCVRVVDRRLVGDETWSVFSEYIDEVNDPDQDPVIVDEDGEVLLDGPLYDEVPLVVTDGSSDSRRFSIPRHMRGSVHYIDGRAVELVVQLVRKILRDSDAQASHVRAEG